jgi:hypothetical protein
MEGQVPTEQSLEGVLELAERCPEALLNSSPSLTEHLTLGREFSASIFPDEVR